MKSKVQTVRREGGKEEVVRRGRERGRGDVRSHVAGSRPHAGPPYQIFIRPRPIKV
jgi:hypothetical protein